MCRSVTPQISKDHNFCALCPFFEFQKELEIWEWEFSKGFWNLKNGYNAPFLAGDLWTYMPFRFRFDFDSLGNRFVIDSIIISSIWGPRIIFKTRSKAEIALLSSLGFVLALLIIIMNYDPMKLIGWVGYTILQNCTSSEYFAYPVFIVMWMGDINPTKKYFPFCRLVKG